MPKISPARLPIMRQRPSPSKTTSPSSAASSSVRNAPWRKPLHSGSSIGMPDREGSYFGGARFVLFFATPMALRPRHRPVVRALAEALLHHDGGPGAAQLD